MKDLTPAEWVPLHLTRAIPTHSRQSAWRRYSSPLSQQCSPRVVRSRAVCISDLCSPRKVVEYNCRFGDPETQVVLPLLQTDLVDIMEAVWEEKLDELDIKWSGKACACVVIASGGYPEKYVTGKEISGLDEKGQSSLAYVYHAGTKLEDGKYYTAGGRVLGVTATGDDLKAALDSAYKAVETITFENAHFRRDIGQRALRSV